MDLTEAREAQLRALLNSRDVSAAIAIRARIGLWHAECVLRKETGPLADLAYVSTSTTAFRAIARTTVSATVTATHATTSPPAMSAT